MAHCRVPIPIPGSFNNLFGASLLMKHLDLGVCSCSLLPVHLMSQTGEKQVPASLSLAIRPLPSHFSEIWTAENDLPAPFVFLQTVTQCTLQMPVSILG